MPRRYITSGPTTHWAPPPHQCLFAINCLRLIHHPRIVNQSDRLDRLDCPSQRDKRDTRFAIALHQQLPRRRDLRLVRDFRPRLKVGIVLRGSLQPTRRGLSAVRASNARIRVIGVFREMNASTANILLGQVSVISNAICASRTSARVDGRLDGRFWRSLMTTMVKCSVGRQNQRRVAAAW